MWITESVIAFVIITAAFAPFPDASLRPGTPAELALALSPALIVPLRRVWLRTMVAAMIGLTVWAELIDFSAPGIVLGLAIVIFTLASRFPRREVVLPVASALILTAAASALSSGGLVLGDAAPLAATIAFAVVLGDASRSRREYLEAVTDRAVKAEESRDAIAHARVVEERLRIARDVHDVVAHQISVISLNAGVASSTLRNAPEAADDALHTIRQACRTVLAEIGSLLSALRDDDGAPRADLSAPQPGLAMLDDLVASFASRDVPVGVRVEGDVTLIPMVTDMVAYRVAQEGLTNAMKHGTGKGVYLRVTVAPARVDILVVNDVALTGASSDGTSSGFGLLGLEERVRSVRGEMTAERSADLFRLEASLPIEEGEILDNSAHRR